MFWKAALSKDFVLFYLIFYLKINALFIFLFYFLFIFIYNTVFCLNRFFLYEKLYLHYICGPRSLFHWFNTDFESIDGLTWLETAFCLK